MTAVVSVRWTHMLLITSYYTGGRCLAL